MREDHAMSHTPSPVTPWRVVVLEDDSDTRSYFNACLETHPGFDLVGSFGTLAAAFEWFSAAAVGRTTDLLLTDLSLPDGNAIPLIDHLSRTHPGCDCLVISVFGDEETVVRCIEAGAVGYLHKDAAPSDIAQTLLEVKAGASPISPMIARKLLTRWRGAQSVAHSPDPSRSPDESVHLSDRETQVLDLIARGYAYAEIARLTGTTINTVQTHIKHLYGKLAVHSRSEAVFEASRMGLLSNWHVDS
jgi:DNA-binding NarL/FixJ family response regulator